MKQCLFFKLAISLGILSILANACRKSAPERDPVTDSIYGTYFQPLGNSGQWIEYLGGTSIIVKPVNSRYVKITVSSASILSAGETIFDSVQMVTNKTFTVNTVSTVPSGNSSPPFYPSTTGNGSFGDKTISMDFKTIIQENPLIYQQYFFIKAKKISDRYE